MLGFAPASKADTIREQMATLKNDSAQRDMDLSALLAEIIEHRLLHAVYQPIIAMRSGDIVGYEGLIRGPVESPLHMPGWLFKIAKRNGLTGVIERLSREIVAKTFVGLGLPGKLFLNVSPGVFTQCSARIGDIVAYLKQIGLSPQAVIIELTENQPINDLEKMREAVLYYRELGFEVAIDDLGEGFASLRLWSELRPEFVKIDKHFIQGVSQDPIKLEFVKAIQQIAACCGSKVIAEGIESLQDLRVVRDIGITYGQGYFIARPNVRPPVEPDKEARLALKADGIAVYPGFENTGNRSAKARKLLIETRPVSSQTVNDDVCESFNDNPNLISLPVVNNGTPVGLIHRYDLIDRFARPFRRELYGRKPCTMFMRDSPLIVEHDLSIEKLSVLVVDGDPRYLTDGFIITENSRYLGVGTARDLIREITQMQINAARYANPLTLLPGNVPISEHMERLLNAGASFCACHFDIDNFKPFNDVYGYFKGDEIIRLVGHLLLQHCNLERDFIGHIGGDGFVVMFQSQDWEKRCREVLEQFGLQVQALLCKKDRVRGGFVTEDRRGQETFYPFPSLSIGAVMVHASELATHLDVSVAAADAKRQAKRTEGNSLFIERRNVIGAASWETPAPPLA